MRIAVIGAGYVGLVAASCLAEAGNDVACVDRDPARIERLSRGELPLWEPGLEALIRAGVAAERLSFRTDVRGAVGAAAVVFLAVGTPSGLEAAVDLGDLDAAVEALLSCLPADAIVALKSTVPVGTHARVTARLRREGLENPVASNPEFLREGSAIADFRRPDRVIVGADDPRAIALLRQLYAPFLATEDRLLAMDPPSAELTKYAANTLLAARVSFVNELSSLAEATGADMDHVRLGLGTDHRIGLDYLQASLGWGGSCFPKDVRALADLGRSLGAPIRTAEAAIEANDAHRDRWLGRIRGAFPSLEGRAIAIWGVAFKAQTSDVRHSPGAALARAMIAGGAAVSVHDPRAPVDLFGDRARWAADPYDAAEGADALLVCTEWPEYRSPDFARLAAAMRGRDVFDGRNLWSLAWMAALPFRYHSVGRPTVGGGTA
jgi:UDPglucose 6-dehydrogenase